MHLIMQKTFNPTHSGANDRGLHAKPATFQQDLTNGLSHEAHRATSKRLVVQHGLTPWLLLRLTPTPAHKAQFEEEMWIHLSNAHLKDLVPMCDDKQMFSNPGLGRQPEMEPNATWPPGGNVPIGPLSGSSTLLPISWENQIQANKKGKDWENGHSLEDKDPSKEEQGTGTSRTDKGQRDQARRQSSNLQSNTSK